MGARSGLPGTTEEAAREAAPEAEQGGYAAARLRLLRGEDGTAAGAPRRAELARVTASHRFLVYGGFPLGALLGGALATVTALRAALLLCAAGCGGGTLTLETGPGRGTTVRGEFPPLDVVG